jgi:outer membrane beta-barrel protein
VDTHGFVNTGGVALLALALAVTAGTGDARAEDGKADTGNGGGGDNAAGDGARDGRTTQMCIDEEIANRLAVKRKRRGAVDRLFVKQARHELTAAGGYYSSDLFSGTYITGGSYTFHMTEDTAVEFGAAYTHADADIIRAIEDGRGAIIDDNYARVLLMESLLIWSPIYGKLRLGGSIMHFDMNLGAGVGVVDSQTSRGATAVAGLGFKLFIGRAVAVRVDVRNHVFRQELLDERFLVNDVAVTSGLSIFLPLRN